MIKLLSKIVADKIAAGEVVDRPLSIVKELVENSIDAGASHITVEIKNGGKSYIRVTDNGCGIYKNEVTIAFMRHATSKISEAEDLGHIITLGFRGEALASISAVSRVELISKRGDEKTGSKLVISEGEIEENVPVGCPDGTTLVVSDLFYNTPARLKFMKSDSTESTLIIDFISKMALAYPEIIIRLINNGTNLFTTPGKGDRFNTVLTVYSRDTGEGLIPVFAESEFIRMEGFVSKPSYSKTNRKHQIFFVNGRVISSKVIETGLEEAYFDKMFDGRFPVAFLFIWVDPSKVDVNIHPNKKEVRFDDDRLIREYISKEIRAVLNTKKSIPEIKVKKPEIIKKSEGEEQVNIKQLLSTLREKEDFPSYIKQSSIEEISDEYSDEFKIGEKKHQPFSINELDLLGVIFGTYLVATLENTFYMIDQHAAHERIFYENLMKQYKNSDKAVQKLLIPFMINVSHTVKENSYTWLDLLADAGFDIEEFGLKSYKISGVPTFMTIQEAQDFITYFVENISEDIDLSNEKIIHKIISKSCKSAIKAGDIITMEEATALISDLSACENPYSCPHGRPTFIKLSKYEIERMFKRV
ncbi:MAG: DNA mismatch repair endonuclease MutL [Peptostreptococcaceae bacterium]|nr:DNA mismatch repair endonuclease MutL [Peptostreptococcaceae bacterium]